MRDLDYVCPHGCCPYPSDADHEHTYPANDCPTCRNIRALRGMKEDRCPQCEKVLRGTDRIVMVDGLFVCSHTCAADWRLRSVVGTCDLCGHEGHAGERCDDISDGGDYQCACIAPDPYNVA